MMRLNPPRLIPCFKPNAMKWLRLGLLASLVLFFLTASGLLSPLVQAQPVSPPRYPVQLYLRCTQEPLLLKTLALMEQTAPSQASLDLLLQTPMRLLFKPMATLGARFKNFDALAWQSPTGQTLIFINEKHRQAPPEALAALLSHEAMHTDPTNSVAEEMTAWNREATVWQALCTPGPQTGTCGTALPEPTAKTPALSALVIRLNKLAWAQKTGTLNQLVQQNPAYGGLPAHSPGF